jgi:signal transduction histidine kinase
MRVVTHSGLGGVLARWLLLPALVLPILLVGGVLAGYQSGAYALPFALALIAASNVVAFTALVWAAAFALDRMETRRLHAEEERILLVAREQAAREEAAAQQRERSRAEAAEREAQRAVRTREEVLAVVSHDLKNPLGSISLSTQLLRRQLPPGAEGERMRKHAETIERSVERMDRLIRDLLDMASLQADRLKLSLGRCAVDDLVREGLALLEPLAIQKGINLNTKLPRERVWVSCDRDRFFQVLSNLVGNALKFTPEGGTVTVEVVPDAHFVRFSVRDTGPGIPAEALPHLFEPFWQVEGTGKKGTGLGLTISRGLVLAHGGSLEVESEEGQGSTFSFTLPRTSLSQERELPVH